MPDYKIINCAVYGTSITEWQKDGTPYNHCLKMVNNAQAEGYVVKGIFWYQGERDTVSSIISKQWKRLFYRFVYNFRQDIGVRAPVVFAQLGPRPIQVRPYWHVIKTQQRLSENSYKSLYMITTGDIVPYCPIDEVHFCPAGYIEIARRFVERFKGIEND